MISYGSHKITFNLAKYIHNIQNIETNKNSKWKGRSGTQNIFCKVNDEENIFLSGYFNKQLNENYDWYFEYFHSAEPAALHTDYDAVPWDEKSDCHIVVGVIIPLEWKCLQPYTVNYNMVSNVPRKMKYSKGEMRYQDTGEIFNYRTEGTFDEEVAKYNPKGTDYWKIYQDLKVHSVYKWQVGTFMLFDTKRWHSSNWFLSKDTLTNESQEYKRSIIGFGSIDVQRN